MGLAILALEPLLEFGPPPLSLHFVDFRHNCLLFEIW